MLAVIFTPLVVGCGAKNVEEAMENAVYSKNINISTSCNDVFSRAVTSKWANPLSTQSTFDYNKGSGVIWFGGSSGVFAVIEFLSPNKSECNVNFYKYRGVWRNTLDSIEEYLSAPYKE